MAQTAMHVILFLVVSLVIGSSARAAGKLEIEVRPLKPDSSVQAARVSRANQSSYRDYLSALKILREDAVLGRDLREKRLIPYQAMPIALDELKGATTQVLPVGLRGPGHNEIVSVDLARGRVERYSQGAPPGAIARQHTCGPVSAEQEFTTEGTEGAAIVTVKSGAETIWRMRVERPSSSGGTWGSGVELREVTYRGRRVLHRAHAPILNVDYDANVCGPFRDPVNREDAFNVEGPEIAPGIVKTASVPQTIFETQVDQGNFWGVAVYEDASQLVLASELSATWYRYASEFRFSTDGTIQPIFKFDAVHNSCTCEAHNHHVYWRFDFDIDQPVPNGLQVQDGGTWRAVTSEEKFNRGPAASAWRVFNPETRNGYEITAGPYDGTTNEFGKGDAWALKYGKGEVDDFHLGTSKDAKLDTFMNGEPLGENDLVFWYAGHIRHAEDHEVPHIAGPTLRPMAK
jgi:hypothetical protein